MGEELTRSLVRLAERGTPRGAAEVLEEARADAAESVARRGPGWRRGLVVALGTAAAVLVLVGAAILVMRPFGGEEVPPATAPPVVPSTVPPLPAPVVESAGSLNDINDLALAPDGSLWAATASGVVRWDVTSGEFATFTEEDGVPGQSVDTVEIASDGTLWVLGEYGIGRYDGSWQVFFGQNTPELAGQLGSLVVDHEGVVWAAVASEPLARYDGTWSSVAAPVGGERVVGPSGLAIDEEGTLWAGTHENGVFSFDGMTWRHFTAADGAPERAWHIAVAPDGAVWAWDEGYYTSPELDEFVPGSGFARYDGAAWITYTVDDGLLSNEGYVAVAADGSVAVVHREWGPDHEEILLGVSRFDGDGWSAVPATDEVSYGPIGATAVDTNGVVWMPAAGGILGFSGTETYDLAVPEELATPPVASWTTVPDPEQAPIRISTAIGDFDFTSLLPSPPRDIGYVADTQFGGVIPGEARLYWSEDYVTWYGTNLLRHQPWLTTDGEDLIGFGDGFTRFRWDGEGWIEGVPVDFRGVTQDIAFGPNGAVALVNSTILYSTNGVDFVEAESGPKPSNGAGLCSESPPPIAGDGIGPILVTEAGYVILGSPSATWDSRASRLCEPLAWFSADGNVWELQTQESPFGSRAAVWDIVGFGGRFVAIGSPWDEPATNVWISDDGIDWSEVDVPQLGTVLGVAGGEQGWFVSGQSTANYGDSALSVDMWFSADGESWDGPYPGPQGLYWAFFRHEASVGSDAIVSVNGTHDGMVIGRLGD